MQLYVGTPGSGKSTHRREHHPQLPVVDYDVMRRHHDLDIPATVADLFDQGTAYLANGTDFVVDGCNLTSHQRQRWLDLARASGQPAHLIAVHTALADCLTRQQHRQHPVARNVVVDYHRRFHRTLSLLSYEPWTTTTTVQGSDTYCCEHGEQSSLVTSETW